MSKKKIVYVKKSDVIRYAEWEGAYKALMYISQLPAEDVRLVKHGRWIGIHEYCEKKGYIPSGMGSYNWCSECEKAELKKSDWCPNCGARMDLKEGEENGQIEEV